MTTTTTPALLYPGEAAHLLGLTEATLERWAADGRLTRRYENGGLRYDAEEVRVLMQAAPRRLVGVVALLEEATAAAARSGDAEVWRRVRALAEEIRGR
jgi:hypothetical protein